MTVSTHQTRFVLTAQDKTKAIIGNFKQSLAGIGAATAQVGQALGLITAGGVGSIGYFVQRQAEAAKESEAYAKALGVGIAALTRWQFAGKRVGLSAQKMGDILKDTAEKIGDAYRNQAGEAKEVLEGLGLEIEHINSLSADQQILAIAGALGQVGTQGEKVQILEALASDASLLLPLLENNAEEFKRLAQVADDTGKTLTTIEAKKLREVQIVMEELRATTDGVSQTLAVALAPAIKQVAQGMLDWSSKLDHKDVERWANGVVTALGLVADAAGWVMDTTASLTASLDKMMDQARANGLQFESLSHKASTAQQLPLGWADQSMSKLNGYQPGDFNSADGDLGYHNLLKDLMDKYDSAPTEDMLKAQNENNRYQAEILQAIKDLDLVARAG